MKTSKFFLTTLFAAAAMTASTYAGEYELSGTVNANTTVGDGKTLNSLTAEDTVKFNGASGFLVGWNGGSLAFNLNLMKDNGDTPAFNWGDGSSGTENTITFTGDVTGEGTFRKKTSASNKKQSFTFTGDVSGYSGNFVNTESSIASKLSFGNGGSAKAVNNISGTGRIEWLAQPVVYNYSSGNLTVGNASISTANLEFAGGANYTVSASLIGYDATKTNNNLKISAGTTTFAGSVSGFGAITVASGATADFADTVVFELSGLTETDGVYTVISGAGTIADTWKSLTKANFSQDGHTIGRGEINLSELGKIAISVDALSLVWNGNNGTWDSVSKNWLDQNGDAEVFCSGDSVTFNTANAEVELAENASVSSMTVAAATTISGEGVRISLAPTAMSIAAGATLTVGEGVTVDFGSDSGASSSTTINQTGLNGTGTVKFINTLGHGTTVKLGSNFNGVLDFTGNFNWAPVFYSLGKDATIKLTSSGSSSLWSGYSSGNIEQNVIFTTDYKIGLANYSLTFSGKVDAAGKALSLEGGNVLTFRNDATIGSIAQNAGTVNFSAGNIELGSFKGAIISSSTAVTVSAGANVNVTGNFILRNEYAGTDLKSVLDIYGKMNVAGNLAIARDGFGYLNVNSGGTLSVGTLVFGANSGWVGDTKGAIASLKGGTLIVGNIGIGISFDGTTYSELNKSSFIFGGGTFGTSAATLNMNVDGLPVSLEKGTTSTINTSRYVDGKFSENAASITIANQISGDGTLRVEGAGTLILSGGNSYTGGTLVAGGTLSASSVTSLGSGTATVDGGKLVANAGLTVSQLAVRSGTAETGGVVSVNAISVSGGTAKINGQLEAKEISVSGGTLDVATLAAVDGKVSVTATGGKIVLKNAASGEHIVDLNGGTISGLDLSSATEASLVRLRAGTLDAANLSVGTLVVYSDFVEAGERTGDYLNNTVNLTIDGSLTLSADKTHLDLSNLVFEAIGEKYALFNIGSGADGNAIVTSLGQIADVAGTFSVEGDYVVFAADAGTEVAMLWDTQANNDYWTRTTFQGTAVGNFENRSVRFGKILPVGTTTENVNISGNARAKSLQVDASEGDKYNLIPGGEGASLTLGSLRVTRGTLESRIAMTVEGVEISGGTLIANAENSLKFFDENATLELNGGVLSLRHAQATNVKNITLGGGSTLEFVDGALASLNKKGLKITGTSESARATLTWLSSQTEDIADYVSIDSGSFVTFNVEQGSAAWGSGAAVTNAGNTYYKTGAGTLSFEAPATLYGKIIVEDGTLQLGLADNSRIFMGDITIDGENSVLYLSGANSFGTEDGLSAVSVSVENGGKIYLFRNLNADMQTLKNVSLSLGDGALIASYPNETNRLGLIVGSGTSVRADGDSEISVTVQLAKEGGATFEVAEGATLTLSGAVVDSLEEKEKGRGLIKTGKGVLELSGTVSSDVVGAFEIYTGETTVNEGTLRFAGNAVPGTGKISIASGAVLEVETTGKVRFDSEVAGISGGSINVTEGTAEFAAKVSGLAATIGANARMLLADSAEFEGSVNVYGVFGGNGTFKGNALLGDGAKLYAGADETFVFQVETLSGEKALTKTGTGDVLLIADLTEDFNLTIEDGVLQTNREQTIDTITLSGGTLGTDEQGAGRWNAAKLNVENGISEIRSSLELNAPGGQNNLRLNGTLYIGGVLGDNTCGSLEVAGTLNLSANSFGSLNIGSFSENGVLAGGRLYADTLNTDSSLKTISLGTEAFEDFSSELAFKDANFAGNISINGTAGSVSVAGTARFEGAGISTIEGDLNCTGDKAVIDVVHAGARLVVKGEMSGALTKLGVGDVEVTSVGLDKVTSLNIANGKFTVEELLELEEGAEVALKQVKVTDGAILALRNGELSLADGGTFELTGDSFYNGDLLVGENNSATIDASEVRGTLTLLGDAVVSNAKVTTIVFGEEVAPEEEDGEIVYNQMSGTLTVLGGAPAIKSDDLRINGDLALSNVDINYETLGFEFTLVEYERALNLFGEKLEEKLEDSTGNIIRLDSKEIDGRDIYLMIDHNANGSGVLKIVAYGTLLWDGAEKWDVGGDSGWRLTSISGDETSEKFSNDKYVGFDFVNGGKNAISVVEDVNIGGAVFKGTGKFTLNFDGGIIKDKSDGTAASVSVQSGTVVFNDNNVSSTDGVFSGGLYIAKGAAVETNSDKLIGSGKISLSGSLSFSGAGATYAIGDLEAAGTDAKLTVVSAGTSLEVKKLSGTVLSKTGAGSLILSESASLDKFVISGGNVTVSAAGESGIKAIVLDTDAGTLTFESGAMLGKTTVLDLAAGKRVEFVSSASNLGSVSLADDSEVAFRSTGTFTVGGEVADKDGDNVAVSVILSKSGSKSSTISGNLALQGGGNDVASATFDVADAGTLKIDGSVSDFNDANAGNFLLTKSGNGSLNITGDLNSKASLVFSAGKITIDGAVNLSGDIEVNGDAALTVGEGGWLGMRDASLFVAEEKTFTLNSSESLSVLGNLAVAGTLVVGGDIGFSGSKNDYKALEIKENSLVTLSSEVASFNGESVKLGANAGIIVDHAQLNASSGVLTVDAAGTSVSFENDAKITFSSIYVTGEQTMSVSGEGEMVVLGEIETKLTLDISEEAGVSINNAKTVQVGKFSGTGTVRKLGAGDLNILQNSGASFTGKFVASQGTTNLYGSLGQASLVVDSELVFDRTAVIGNSGTNVVANALVGGSGLVAVLGEENSLKFTNAIGSEFAGTLEARDGGTLIYNQVIADDGIDVSLKNAGCLSVSELKAVENEMLGSLKLGKLSVSGKNNEVALAASRELDVASIIIADSKGVETLTFSGAGTATIAGSISKAENSKAELDLYTSDDFAGTLTLGGANSAHRNTYIQSGTVVFSDASAGGTGTVFLTNAEKSVARFDVGDGNVVSTSVAGIGTIEGKSGTIAKMDAFSGSLVAVDGGTFTLNRGNATELASASINLGAEAGATLIVTTDKTVSELDMGAASFAGEGTVRLDLVVSQSLSVYSQNTIAGTLEIAGGSVKVMKGGDLGTAALSLGAGTTLNLASDVLYNREISGAGTLVKNTSGTSFVAGTVNAKASVATGVLSVAKTADNAQFSIKNGTLEFSQTYENGAVVSRKTGTANFDAEYVVDGVARFSHSARNSNSVVDGTLKWKNDVVGSLIFAGGGTGSEFLPEIESGSIVKTGSGKWYLDSFASSGSIKVENGGGTLALGGYVGNANQEIYIGRDGVLEITEFGENAEPVINGKLSGSGILAVSVSTGEVTLDFSGESDWILRVDPNASVKYGSGISASDILLVASENTQDMGGTLSVNVAAESTSDFGGKTLSIQGASKDFLDVRNAKAVKSGSGTWDLSSANVELNGLLQIKEGTVKVVSFKSNPTSGVVEVQGNGVLEVGAAGKTGNLAALAGAGYVRFVAGTTAIENVNGAQSPEEFNSDFSGNVQIDAGASVIVKPYASFGNASRINVLGTLESSQLAESALTKLNGDGTLRINNMMSSVRTVFAGNNNFDGKIEIARGRLVMTTDVFGNANNEISVSSDAESGLVLRNESGAIVSLASLNGKNVGGTGTFFLESADADSAFVLNNGDSFGYGAGIRVDSGAELFIGKGATLTTGLHVAENATLRLGNAGAGTSLSLRAGNLSAARTVEGDLTIAGNLATALPAAGTVAIRATGKAIVEKTAIVEVDGIVAAGEEFALIASDVKAIENGALFRTASGERLSARVAENATQIKVGLATPVSDLIPSGLDSFAETIFSDTDSAIYKAIYWSGTDAEQRAKLVNFSPVSFAGALDLSTGLTQIENDLLRQRLEQRRYDRAYPEAEGTFKAFANIIGSSADSDEGQNKVANYDMSHTGAVAGFDSLVTYDFLIGASFTYDFGKAKVHNGGGKHETDTARINVYGMAMLDDVSYFGFGAGFGVIGLDTKRTNSLETLKADASGTDLSLSATLGRMFVLSAENGLHVSPYIGLDYTYSRIGGFSETGGKESALDVDDLERNSLRGTIGATLNWLPAEDWRFTLEAAYRHEFLDTDSDIDAKFIGGAYAGMDASGTAYFNGEDVISVGPRVEYRINSKWAVSAGYTFESDFDNATAHSANLGVRCKF